MDDKKIRFQFRVVREKDRYSILTKQGIKIADFLVPADRQLIRDSVMLREILTVLEWRYGLRKEKFNGTKGNVHDLFYYQIAVNGYSIYKGIPEDGGVITVGRVLSPADYKYERDEVMNSELLKILDKRLYWK